MWPEKETDLAAPVIAWLEQQAWDVYQEVELSGGIADIVATQGPLIWTIELKKTLGLDVLAQGTHWTSYAHFSSVAVPYGRLDRARHFAHRILREHGVGLMYVARPTIYAGGLSEYNQTGADQVKQEFSPALHRKVRSDSIRKVLAPEHKTHAQAGGTAGGRWTKFRQTCERVAAVVKENPGIGLKELINSIEHHYHSDSTARNSLRVWIEKGIVEGVELRREGRLLKIYPKGV